MSLPCDQMHWHWGPAVTGALARSLHQEGWSGKRIAEALGLTGAAVSHYLKFKRGTRLLPPNSMNSCMKLAKSIASGKVKRSGIGIKTASIAVMAMHEGKPKLQKDMLSLCKSCLSPKLAHSAKPHALH